MALSLQTYLGQRLVGIDLSPKMLQMAEKRNLYTQLVCGDICDAKVLKSLLPPYDLIVAADVLGYLGDLRVLFAAAAELVKPQGLWLFSLEPLGKKAKDYELQRSGRFKHRLDYVTQCAETYGFELLAHKEVVGRQQDHKAVPFEVVLLQNRME